MNKKHDLTKRQKLILTACTGVLLLLVLWPVSGKRNDNMQTELKNEIQNDGMGKKMVCEDVTDRQALDNYINRQEKRLEDVLSSMDGVGHVSVMITARASRKIIVEKDISNQISSSEGENAAGEKSKTNNSVQSEVTIMREDAKTKLPYVVKALEPEIEGIAVAASGADNIDVKAQIVNTVRALYNVPLYKINVAKLKPQA